MAFKSLVLLGTLVAVAAGHGLMTAPRCRGALDFRRGGVVPAKLADDATIDYCSHCLNAGGTGSVKAAGPWSSYKPMERNNRGGFGICGDPAGSNDHMKSGRFANPASKPFVANYEAGGVANFEFDATTNHGGYVEFYLCDVENNPGQDIEFSTFSRDCHYLERVPNSSCESGNDMECGPIDPKFPGRWVLPCRNGAGDQGDQVLGGSNGKMAYRIPNVNIKVGVVHMYWLTTNTCNTPDGFMQNYKYPSAWAGCNGDGGSVGGKPQHTEACGRGGFPEEFWNCADVTVGGSDGSAPPVPRNSGNQNNVENADDDDDADDVDDSENGSDTPKDRNDETGDGNGKENNNAGNKIDGTDVEDIKLDNNDKGEKDGEGKRDEDPLPSSGGSCVRGWGSCTVGSSRCCSEEYKCARYWGSAPMCVPKEFDSGPSGGNEEEPAKDTGDGSGEAPADNSPEKNHPEGSGSENGNHHSNNGAWESGNHHNSWSDGNRNFGRYRRGGHRSWNRWSSW